MPPFSTFLRVGAERADKPADGWIVAGGDAAGLVAQLRRQHPAKPVIAAIPGDADTQALFTALSSEPDAVLAAGIGDGADLQRLDARLAVAEAERGWAEGRIAVWIEAGASPAAVFRLGTLAGASPRLQGLVWQPAALATALGVPDAADALRIARSLTVLAAHAAGVPVLFDAGSDPIEEADLRREGFWGVIRPA